MEPRALSVPLGQSLPMCLGSSGAGRRCGRELRFPWHLKSSKNLSLQEERLCHPHCSWSSVRCQLLAGCPVSQLVGSRYVTEDEEGSSAASWH